MAEICPVCNKKIGLFDERRLAKVKQENQISVHLDCVDEFKRNPEKYGFKAIEKTEAQINADKEHQEQQLRIEEKSVHVKSFDMPFGDMVGFMVKWAIASIPALLILFIILAIIGAIFFAIFGALFF